MEKSWNCLFSWLWQLSSLWLSCMLWDSHNHIWNQVRMGLLERSKSVMGKSWNSVFKFLWEPCKCLSLFFNFSDQHTFYSKQILTWLDFTEVACWPFCDVRGDMVDFTGIILCMSKVTNPKRGWLPWLRTYPIYLDRSKTKKMTEQG